MTLVHINEYISAPKDVHNQKSKSISSLERAEGSTEYAHEDEEFSSSTLALPSSPLSPAGK